MVYCNSLVVACLCHLFASTLDTRVGVLILIFDNHCLCHVYWHFETPGTSQGAYAVLFFL